MRRGAANSASPSIESNPDDNSLEDVGGPNGAKRRRIALACSACRTRKSRCNGQRPKCSLCDRMGFECTYEMPSSSSNLIIGRDTIAALESRLEAVERRLSRQSNNNSSPRRNNGFLAADSPRPGNDQDGEQRTTVPPGMVVVAVQNLFDADSQGQNDKTDGMAMSLVDDETCSFFGPTSNIALMRTIFRAVAYKKAAGTVNPGFKNATAAANNNNATSCSSAINLARMYPDSPESITGGRGGFSGGVAIPRGCNILPSREETERLIEQYFCNTGKLFPYIHKPAFLETYHGMRDNNFRVNVRRSYLGLLNMVLAMAALNEKGKRRSGGQAGERSLGTESDVFYRRAQQLCRRQLLGRTSLEIVQFLLLTSQYLQGTQKSLQTWAMHGLAVKTALSIGIHSKESLRKLPVVEQEMGKRTWFGCVLLDRHLSMTFGRPSAIPDDYVRLDLPQLIPGDHIDNTGILFYIATFTLYKILWRIMGNLYGHNLGCEETPQANPFMQILMLQHDLSEWQNSLAPGIGIVSLSGIANLDRSNPIGERYRLILTLRFLNTQLLLHRPVLTNLLSTELDPSQPHQSISQMQLNLSNMSRMYAREIISIVNVVLTSPDLGNDFLGAWWFTLYYVFNASLVVFGDLLIRAAEGEGDFGSLNQIESGQQALSQAIEALAHLDQDNNLTNQCIGYLEDLSRIVEEWVLASPKAVVGASTSSSRTQIPTTSMNHHGLLHKLGLGVPFGDMGPDDNIDFMSSNLDFDPEFNDEFQRWFGDNLWSADLL